MKVFVEELHAQYLDQERKKVSTFAIYLENKIKHSNITFPSRMFQFVSTCPKPRWRTVIDYRAVVTKRYY